MDSCSSERNRKEEEESRNPGGFQSKFSLLFFLSRLQHGWAFGSSSMDGGCIDRRPRSLSPQCVVEKKMAGVYQGFCLKRYRAMKNNNACRRRVPSQRRRNNQRETKASLQRDGIKIFNSTRRKREISCAKKLVIAATPEILLQLLLLNPEQQHFHGKKDALRASVRPRPEKKLCAAPCRQTNNGRGQKPPR